MEPTVKPTGPSGARIMLVGEAPGEQEILRGEPFMGAAGLELTKMLHEAGLGRNELFITYVARQRPFANDISRWMALTKKDAAALLQQPGSGYLHGKPVAAPILEGYEMLRKEVALVKPHVIIAVGNLAMWATAGQWAITDWRGSTIPCLIEGCQKVVPLIPPQTVLRQWSWRQITVQDLRRAKREAENPSIVHPHYNTIIRPDYSAVIRNLDFILSLLAGGPIKLAVDIETRMGHIACIGWAWSNYEAFCLPLMQSGRPDGYWMEEEEVSILMKLQQVLTHPNIECIFQNGLYDLQYFHRHLRFIPRMVRDTMLMQHSCFATMSKGLGFLSSLYCEHHRYWKDDGKDWNTKLQGEEALWTYNGEDCGRTFEIDTVLTATVDKLGLNQVSDFQQFLVWPVLWTMNRGVRIDLKERSRFALELSDELAKREQWFIDALGHPLNPRSPTQLKRLFYEDFKLPIQRSRQTGEPTLNDEALNRLAEKEPLIKPIVRKILECRSIGVFLGTFVNASLDRDQRMRCSYNIAGTDTYRFASRENAFGSGCVPADAEVLTYDGWQRIDEVVQGQLVAQWEPSGAISFQPAIPFHTYYEGNWYEGVGEQFQVCLTDGHRVPFLDKYGLRLQETAAATYSKLSNTCLPLAGLIEGKLLISYPKLLVAVLADGSYEGNLVRISFTKQRKIDRILELFQLYKIDWWENAAKPGYRRFVFRKPEDWPEQKRWGWWITALNLPLAQEMLQECRYWDGHDRGSSFWFFSADREQAEIIATLAHLTGNSATLRREEQNEGSYSDTVMWVVNVKPRSYARVQRTHWHTTPYKGEVYCITVPSSYFLMRYRGKICVTGNTNLQNIPKGGDTDGGELELPNVRSLFIPDPGYTFFDTDLSSADLRVVVWESDEVEMKRMLLEGLDPYTEVAKEFYHDPSITKKDPRRQKFKSFCHGTNYLGSARGLAMRLGLSIAEAEKTQAWYFRRFPRIRDWQEATKDQIRKHHYVQNGFGYRCYFFDRIDDDVFRRAAAWIPQSSVGCYINRIWARWSVNVPQVEVLLQVHDSLAGQIPTMDKEPVLRAMLAEAQQVSIPYADPLIIPLGVKMSAKSWGDCE